MSKLDAVNELLLTIPDFLKNTPLGLTSTTFPFEFTRPAILDGVEPNTLFSEEELDDGMLKSTTPDE